MHGVRLDRFSRRLLDIHVRGKAGSKQPCKRNADEGREAVGTAVGVDPAMEEVAEMKHRHESAATSDDDEGSCLYSVAGSDDGDSSSDSEAARARIETPELPFLDRVVAPTDCDACGKHATKAMPTTADLTAEIKMLKERVTKLELRV